jgi:hypothetical protein
MQGYGTEHHTGATGATALLVFGVLACATALPACRSTSPEPEPEPEDVTLDEFRDLLAQGGLRPANGMEGDDAFGESVLDSPGGEDPTEGAARRLGDPDRLARWPESPIAQPIEPLPPPENPYLEFGKRIKVHPDGRITKPYPLRVGTGSKLDGILRSYGGFPIYDPAVGDQGPNTVRIDLQEGWDIELYANLRAPKVEAAVPIPLSDWLIVTAAPELMREVESFINIFAAGVPQIEIEAKIVEVRTFDSLDIGVTENGGPIFDFPDGTAIDSFTYDFPIDGVGGTLAVGTVLDGTTISAALDVLARYENVSIISRPTIAVREGGRAEIITVQRIPFLNVVGVNAGGQPNFTVQYEEFGVRLYVVPRVVGTETVALNIDVEASQQAGSAVTFTSVAGGNTSSVSNPIISSRSARTTVYLEPGQAVILGGLITERLVEQEDKVPILGDIPLLGYLFRSTFTSKEQANVLFFIRPRILEGSDLNREF